jgi:hypothetical protein
MADSVSSGDAERTVERTVEKDKDRSSPWKSNAILKAIQLIINFKISKTTMFSDFLSAIDNIKILCNAYEINV